MNGGKAIFLYYAFRDQNGVFEVVAVPRHERHAHVLTQRQLTEIGGRAISQHITTFNRLAQRNTWHLIDTGVLVGACVLGQVVDIDTRFTRVHLIFVDFNHDTRGINVLNGTTTFRYGSYAGVYRYRALHTGTNQRLISTQSWNRLTLHVCTHQCAVGVIVLQERDQRCTDGNYLLGRNVHVINLIATEQARFAFTTAGHQVINKRTLFSEVGVGLSDNVVTLFNRREVMNFIGNQTFAYATVWGFKETILVGLCIHRQGVDQTDVWTFRRFDWTHTTVMRRVNVSNFKACTLTRQTARAESRNTTLMRDL